MLFLSLSSFQQAEKLANTACTGRRGFAATYKHFSGFGLFLLSGIFPARPGMLYTARNGYKLVAVEIVLGNVSVSEALSVNPLYAYLVDNNGFVYSAELGGRDDQIDTVDLGTGEKAKGWVAFTIPEDGTPASIKYSTSALGGPYLQTGVTN